MRLLHGFHALVGTVGFELLGGLVGVGVCLGSVAVVWMQRRRQRRDSPVRPDQS